MCTHPRLSSACASAQSVQSSMATLWVPTLLQAEHSDFDLTMQMHRWIGTIGVAPITQVTHKLNKNSNIQGRSLDVIIVIFNTIRNCS